MSNPIRSSHPIRFAGLAVALALTLAACGSGDHQVSDPPPDRAAYPVVEAGQASSVLDAVDGAVVRGVAAKDTPNMVDARLLGPFRELELANARIAAERKKKVPRQVQVQRLRLIVPTSLGWPRFFIAVGSTTETSTPVLRVLSSAAPRAPYGLWAQATMLPGATLPPTVQAAVGSTMVAPDASGLVASPKEVLSGFAGYLNAGAKTTATRQFERSVFSDQLIQRLVADRKGLKGVGSVSSKHTVSSVPPLAVRTTDGGALVVGEFQQQYTVTLKKGALQGASVTDKDVAALAGGKNKFSKSLTQTAVEVVVFDVPAKGKGLITVIAAQKGDVQAVAK